MSLDLIPNPPLVAGRCQGCRFTSGGNGCQVTKSMVDKYGPCAVDRTGSDEVWHFHIYVPRTPETEVKYIAMRLTQ